MAWKQGYEHKNSNWKGNNATVGGGRQRARRKYSLPIKCEKCKTSRATDRHHLDGNTLNNRHSNIMFLCRSCHMAIDGRSKRATKRLQDYWKKRPGPRNKPYPHGKCGICGRFNKKDGKCPKTFYDYCIGAWEHD